MHICKVLFTTKLALVLILGYMVVRTVLLPERIENALAPASVQAGDRTHNTETKSSPDLLFADYAQIVKKNPFGISGQTTNSGEQALAINFSGFGRSVSEELGLALSGTVSGSLEVARAIIKDIETGVSDQYKTGQVVGDARIESINTDMVILLHNGERKILRFNAEASGSNHDYDTRAPLSRTADETENHAITGLLTQESDPAIQKKPGYVETILNKVVIDPYAINNQIEGLKITGLENIKAMQGLGLKNGDIVRMVNGHQLTSKQKAYQVFKKARSQSDINLELSRDGKTKKLSIGL